MEYYTNESIPAQYIDCVMRYDTSGHYYGSRSYCKALTKMYCAECGACKFYASSKEYYRRKTDGFIMRKDGVL